MLPRVSTQSNVISVSDSSDAFLRLQGILSHLEDVKQRLQGLATPAREILFNLIDDFAEVAQQLYSLLEHAVSTKLSSGEISPELAWQKRHQMVEILTEEWRNVFSFVSTTVLGNSYTSALVQFVNQAALDLDLTQAEDNFILFPKIGPKFSLSAPRYATKTFLILEVPLSVINAPWEWTVIWHELASVKVKKIRDEIKRTLDTYAQENQIKMLDEAEPDPVSEVLDRIDKGRVIDRFLRDKVKLFIGKRGGQNAKLWTLEWFTQLFEDACSVLAFGEDFIFVLEKILYRDQNKLSGDRTHPDLTTRLGVARRLLLRKAGEYPPPGGDVDKAADLLWNFIRNQKPDSDAYLPIAFETAEQLKQNEPRSELIYILKTFKTNFKTIAKDPTFINDFETRVSKGFAINVRRSSVKSGLPESPRKDLIKKRLSEILKDKYDEDTLLSLALSETDFLALTDHADGDRGDMSITVHGKLHEFYHFGWNHKE